MAKQKRQKTLQFDWDTSPDEQAGFTEIRLPGYQVYYLNFQQAHFDPANRVFWWIDIARVPANGGDEIYEKVVIDFAPDALSAKQAAEAAFMRLLKPPKFKVAT